MKIIVDLVENQVHYTDFEWPAWAPPPSAGDSVLAHRNGKPFIFEVKNRLVTLGVQPETGEPSVRYTLTVEVVK